MNPLLLDKWYVDVADERGRVAIVHAAVLRFGPVHLRYGAVLTSSPGATHGTKWIVSHDATVRAGEMPMSTISTTDWTCGPLGLTVRCEDKSNGNSTQASRLLESGAGFVDWQPIHTRAEVAITTPAITIRGLGYAERLIMTVKPWELPIDVLRWGRWIGAASSLAWVRWDGAHPLTLVVKDGYATSPEVIDDDRVCAGGSALTLTSTRTLRDASIGDTLLSIIPGVRSWAPARMLASCETRFLSRGVRIEADGTRDEGWAIHEVVRFVGAPT